MEGGREGGGMKEGGRIKNRHTCSNSPVSATPAAEIVNRYFTRNDFRLCVAEVTAGPDGAMIWCVVQQTDHS